MWGMLRLAMHLEMREVHNQNFEFEQIYRSRLYEVFSFFEKKGVDARLTGSLGRTASLRVNLQDLNAETGKLDIDLLILDSRGNDHTDIIKEAKRTVAPIHLEEVFNGQITLNDSTASIRYKDLTVVVDPTVFSKHQGQIFGIDVPTLDPNTLFHLTSLYGVLRPKDFYDLRKFARYFNKANVLEERLFLPFHELNKARQNKYKLNQYVGQLRWCYLNEVPEPARELLSPITKPIWNTIRRKMGK